MTTKHIDNFLEEKEATSLFEYLRDNAGWRTWVYAPNSRPIARYSFDDLPQQLENVFRQIEQNFGVRILRQAFLNIYRNGQDYCPYHADKYGVDTFTLSLGATRDFLLKPNRTGTRAEKLTLQSGDLYFMPKELHQTHRHSVPKRKNVTEPRISILMFVQP